MTFPVFYRGKLVRVASPVFGLSEPVRIKSIPGRSSVIELEEEVFGFTKWLSSSLRPCEEPAELIIYDASDGIENALYPYRWATLSSDPKDFPAVAAGVREALSFLYDNLTGRTAFAIKTGDTVVPYEDA